MLPNPVSIPTPSSTAPAANDRPQLKIAARSEQDARDQHRATSVVINDDLREWHGQWQRTLETVKATLADLERTCESAMDAREADVTGLIDTLVESASAEAAAAAEETRAQAQSEIAQLRSVMTELQTRVDALQGELDAERESVKSIKTQLEIDVAERVRAETERDEARRECERQSAAAALQVASLRSDSEALSAELTTVRQQLDAAIAERSKLATTFQVIQQALAQGPPANMAALSEGAGAALSSLADRPPQGARAENRVTAVASLASNPPADARSILAERHPDVVEDIARVLEQVEDIYQLDLKSGRSGTELVDALSGSLRYARDLIVARWHRDDCEAETLFAYQMAVALDLKAGTSFGRHLSIAAYDLPKPAESPAQGSERETTP
jgi:hypothetical protein